MSAKTILRRVGRALPWAALLVLLLTSIYLMSVATQEATRFGDYFVWLLAINGAALVLLLAVIAQQSIRLYRHLKRGTPGARLIRRFVLVFVGLVTPPVVVVYLFSLALLNRGIDSWFDVRVEQSLRSAKKLSQLYLKENMRDLLERTHRSAEALSDVPSFLAAERLHQLLRRTDAQELTLFTASGDIIATASTTIHDFVPDYPEDVALLIARRRDFYAAVEPAAGGGLKMRVLVNLGAPRPRATARLLQAIFRVPETMGDLADRIAEQYRRYQTLMYLRGPLTLSFTLTLSLVLLLSLLLAMVVAFRAARRLVAPIRGLSRATEDVAAGHYGRQLPVSSDDELGFLVRSFNTMTERLERSTQRDAESRRLLENQRAYLQAVLSRLSSGVVTVNAAGELRTANRAAGEILGVDLAGYEGRPLDALATDQPELGPLLERIQHAVAHARTDWREQVVLFGSQGRQVLMCRGAKLSRTGGNQVVVFDDLTALIRAQRDSAWGEMARRLAHEVKNPLTPIQLSAERLRRRYLRDLDPEESRVLDRATQTIVQQVEALKKLINAFGDYARAPELQLETISLNRLVRRVAELYQSESATVDIELALDGDAPDIAVDPDRIRQLIHNLIINAREAMEGREACRITLATRTLERAHVPYLELTVTDSGPGFPAELLDTLFEPYTTTKPRGSGLGLAIVRKIVDEHHGLIRVDNPASGGARVTVQLPVAGQETTETKPA